MNTYRSLNLTLRQAIKSTLIAGFTASIALTTGIANAASCPIYALQDNNLNDTQLFTVVIDPETKETLAVNLGPEYPGLDIEGLAIHPVSGELYATSGDDAELETDVGVLYKVDKTNGDLTRIGKAYDGEISALAFSDDGTVLWGWVDRQGFIEINPETGEGTLLAAVPEVMVEDITTGLNDAGQNILYAVAGNQLYAYNVDAATPELMACDSLPSEAEAIEMLADGSLLYALHSNADTQIHQFDLDSDCKVINTATIPTQYYDIEGLAVPPNCLSGNCPPGEWQVAMDSFDDASEAIGGRTVYGGNSFEIYSLAMKQVGDEVTVVIRANLPLEGAEYKGVNINWGDLILDFSGNGKGGKLLSNVSDSGVYGVRFSADNDSSVSQLGLYEVRSTKYVGRSNYGWYHLQQNKTYVTGAGSTPSLGDLEINNAYFKDYNKSKKVPTSISAGQHLGGLSTPEASALSDYDYALPGAFLDPRASTYNQASQDGNPPNIQALSFTFTKTPEMTGDFVAYLFIECLNDGIALKGTFEDCPDEE